MATFTMFFKDAITEMGGEIVTTDNATHLQNAHLCGLGGYPVFRGDYRQRLNGLIVDRYMNREIGSETVSEFRRMLRSRMNEIMPMYNRMYQADMLKFDPMRTIDLRVITEGVSEAHNTGTASGMSTDTNSTTVEGVSNIEASTDTETDNRSRAVASDTPQTRLSGTEDYASSSADQTGRNTAKGESTEDTNTRSDTESESTGSSNTATSAEATSEDRTDSHSFGYQGNPSQLIIDYRNSLVNTDMLVLDELDVCFMQIYGTDELPTFRYNRFGYWY